MHFVDIEVNKKWENGRGGLVEHIPCVEHGYYCTTPTYSCVSALIIETRSAVPNELEDFMPRCKEIYANMDEWCKWMNFDKFYGYNGFYNSARELIEMYLLFEYLKGKRDNSTYVPSVLKHYKGIRNGIMADKVDGRYNSIEEYYWSTRRKTISDCILDRERIKKEYEKKRKEYKIKRAVIKIQSFFRKKIYSTKPNYQESKVKNYKIAIPSYDRPTQLKNKTLATLARAGITTGITIFVANNDERTRYRQVIKKTKIVVGKIGITAQRNFIKRHYKRPNTCILVLDDDLERFERINRETQKFEEITDLKELFSDCFCKAKNEGVNLWGVYGARNPMFMSQQKREFSLGFKFIIGCCYGYIVEKDMSPYMMDERIKIKQDYEQSVLHYKAMGNVLRFNWITIKTKFYAEGGLGKKAGRHKQNTLDQQLLIKKYPEYFRPKFRKDGTAEVRCIRNPKRRGDTNEVPQIDYQEYKVDTDEVPQIESKVDTDAIQIDYQEESVNINDDRYTMDIGKTGKKSGIKIKKRNKKTLEELLEICINEGCKYVSWDTKKNQGWVYKEDAELKNCKKNKEKYKFYTLI